MQRQEEEEEEIQTKPLAEQITPLVQRQVNEEEEEEPVQAKPIDEQITPLVQRQEEEEEEIQTKPLAEQISPLVQRQVGEEEKESIKTKRMSGHSSEVTPEIASNISALRGSGGRLSKAVRDYFEPRFGFNFGDVRVHTGVRAAETAQSINARAFTVGRNMVFGTGRYSPETSEGKKLLAHELTHVVQQNAKLSPMLQMKKIWINHIDIKFDKFAQEAPGYDDEWYSLGKLTAYKKNKIAYSSNISGGGHEGGLTDKVKKGKVWKIGGPDYKSSHGNVPMPWPIFFKGKQAIHQGELDHASLACVHVPNLDLMENINKDTKKNTTVVNVDYEKKVLDKLCPLRIKYLGGEKRNPCHGY